MLLGFLFLFVPRTVSVGSTSGQDQRHLVNVAEAKEDVKEEVKYYRIQRESDKEIIEEITRVFKGDSEAALSIARCESGLRTDAFNPETAAKRKGITKYSSCGIFQINDPRCVDENNDRLLDATSVLYDYKYNIDIAKDLFERRGFQPWTNCARKLGFL